MGIEGFSLPLSSQNYEEQTHSCTVNSKRRLESNTEHLQSQTLRLPE